MNATAAPPTPIRVRHTVKRANRPVEKMAKIPSFGDLKKGKASKEDDNKENSLHDEFGMIKQKSLRWSKKLEITTPPMQRSKSLSHINTPKSILKNKDERPVISTKHLSMRNLSIADDEDDLDMIFEAAANAESMEKRVQRLEEELKKAKEQLEERPVPKSGGLRLRNIGRVFFPRRNARSNSNSTDNNKTNEKSKTSAPKRAARKFLAKLFGRNKETKQPASSGTTPPARSTLQKAKSVSNLSLDSSNKNDSTHQKEQAVESAPVPNKRKHLRKAKSASKMNATEVGDMQEVKRSLMQPLKPKVKGAKVDEDDKSSSCKFTSLMIGNQSSFKDLNASFHSSMSSVNSDAMSMHSKESVKRSNKSKSSSRGRSAKDQDDNRSVSSKKSTRSRSRKQKGSTADDWASAHSKMSATVPLDIHLSQDDDASSTYESCYDDMNESFSLCEASPHVWCQTPGQKSFVELDIRHLDNNGSAKSLTLG